MFLILSPSGAHMSLVHIILLLLACGDPPDTKDSSEGTDPDTTDTSEGTNPARDFDGDGFTTEAGDCDDGNADVNPDAIEVCGGLDEDCDGVTDEEDSEGCEPFFEDADGDGYGSSSACLCGPEGDYTAEVDGDCDDSDPSSYPGAAETCDEKDSDCDGTTSDEDSAGCAVYFTDADGDGYGTEPSACLCEPRDDLTTTLERDCDDTNSLVNPAATETCDDGLDNDCDGGPGSCLLSGEIELSAADAKFTGEESSDYAGWSLASGDMNGDGVDDILVGAAYQGSTNAGAAYLVNGPVSGEKDLAIADATFVGTYDTGNAGTSVASADMNGDGIADVLVGAPWEDRYAYISGSIYVLNGPVSGEIDLSETDAMFVGEKEDIAGMALATGDANGDGAVDLLISSWDDTLSSGAGGAFLVLGPVSGEMSLADAAAKLMGESAGECVGGCTGTGTLAMGDMNGDGFDDLLMGAMSSDGGGNYSGAAYVEHGPVSGEMGLSSAVAFLVGEQHADEAGTSVALADLNDDGLDDIVVGAPYNDRGGSDAGTAYVFFGPVSGEMSLSASDVKLIGPTGGDAVGYSMAIGDVDADGSADLLVGAIGEGAFLLLGPVTSGTDLSMADAIFKGGEYAGSSVALGNVGGGGVPDILVGAIFDDSSAYDAGAAFIVLDRM